jgi:hypothetical protein
MFSAIHGWSLASPSDPSLRFLRVHDFDDAIALANATAYGLSSGVVTTSLEKALKAVKQLRCGTVNINEGAPGSASNTLLSAESKIAAWALRRVLSKP